MHLKDYQTIVNKKLDEFKLKIAEYEKSLITNMQKIPASYNVREMARLKDEIKKTQVDGKEKHVFENVQDRKNQTKQEIIAMQKPNENEDSQKGIISKV